MNNPIELNNIEWDKLFLGICLALVPMAFSSILVSNILNELKTIE